MADEQPKRVAVGSFFDIKSIGRRRAFFQDFYHRVLRASWFTFFGLIVVTFLFENTVFACLYLLQKGSIAGAHDTFSDAFFFSVQSLATIGYGTWSPATLYGHILVTIEALGGLLGFALITGMTFAKFSRPTARVLFSNKAVVGERNGERFLMFRMANERHNQIVEATVRVVLLQNTVTKEGEFLRIPRELKMVRTVTTFFRLTWTATHVIDEASPFFGDDAIESLRKQESEIYLSIQGLDETLAQTVHARYAYTLDDIVWNARFADVIEILPDGTRQIDYRNFHETISQRKGDTSGRATARPESPSEEPAKVETAPLSGEPAHDPSLETGAVS